MCIRDSWKDDETYEKSVRAVQFALKNISTTYFDLVLMLWPGTPTPQDRLDTWKALEDMVDQGLTKSIGVSNFLPRHLDSILPKCRIKPVVNQIETHPLYYDKETIEYCKKNDILVEAYAPLAQGNKALLENEVLKRIGSKYHKSAAQVALRWGVQHGFAVIPKSKSEQRVQENITIDDFELTAEEIDEINGLNANKKMAWNPSTVASVSYTHLRAHETGRNLVCRLLLEKKKRQFM
eukprot:TRINITY_DN2000_c0_g3_i3.p1 TRINITY_DN2000_c0_g3~~TRINITY_DN2000_c0_g3_i3.p1  ORF type:complete len:237 (+),score=66.03 TRINITY_DN2000_c0_g3_i3:66-776(+)